MSTPDPVSIEERLARLERMVEALHERLGPHPGDAEALAAARVHPLTGAGTGDWTQPAPPERQPLHPHGWAREAAGGMLRWDGQTWLNRIGIVLLLLGVALLFRYSIDQGWLTPGVRVGFGAAVGAALLGIGLALRERRFAAVLVGGGIATFYLTGWAAFNLYTLVGYLPAFAGMVAITLGAFWLALHRDAPPLAVLGAFGGLGTPLILGISFASPRGLALYTAFILAWTAGLYLRRGWWSVLWTSLVGGWLLLALYANWLPTEPRGGAGQGWVQAAAVFAWLALGVVPFARRLGELRGARAAQRGDRPFRERRWTEAQTLHWYGAALVSPVMALATTALVWRLAPEAWGMLAVGAAAVYGAGAAALFRADARLARVLLFASSLLLSTGFFAVLSGEALLAALTAQAVGLHLLAARGAGAGARWMAHKVFTGIALWVLYRLLESGATDARRVAADLAVIGAGFGVSYLLRVRGEVLAYRLFAHGAAMGWVWRELAPLDGGQGIVTIAWGAYGLGLLLLAGRRGSVLLERIAICTLLAAVAKLFIVDLAALDALFRVVLFLGFGAAFLWTSYVLPAWWRAPAHPDAPAPER